MRQRKYALPRHTILAKQGARTSAFLVDFAITLVITMVFVFALFRPVFKKRDSAYVSTYELERLNSGLYIKDEKGDIDSLPGDADAQVFVDSMEYFYLHYLSGTDLKEGLEPSKEIKNYTMEWFNQNILMVGDSTYNYYEYQKTDGVDDPSKIATRIEGINDDLVNKLVQSKYVSAIQDEFNNLANVKKAGAMHILISAISYLSSFLIAGIICYIVLPLIFKNGQTLGKKLFKLGLANADGYKFSSSRLIMRFVPFLVVVVGMIFLIEANLYIALTIVTTLLLVSFALAMSSPKRMSLHDFTAQTIVIDLKGSILFNNAGEEEEYVLKEDNLFSDLAPINEGEEPELKYEKWRTNSNSKG